MKVNIKGKIILGNNIEALKEFPDNHFDSIVTDPPYGLGDEPDVVEVLKDWLDKGFHEVKSVGGFMNMAWDSFVPQPAFWKEAIRVLKPGGHVLSFFGDRTYDWGVMAMRFAGFEIRTTLTWLYGSGFPKALDVSKAIDEHFGAERKILATGTSGAMMNSDGKNSRPYHEDNRNDDGRLEFHITESATPEAKAWEGWKTNLKPAVELIALARKPLDGTVAENILKWGVGALNIDACRIELTEGDDPRLGGKGEWQTDQGLVKNVYSGGFVGRPVQSSPLGRFPSNVIVDQDAAAMIDQQAPSTGGLAPVSKGHIANNNGIYGDFASKGDDGRSFYNDMGGASRFFYCPKASASERNAGLEKLVKEKKIGHNRFDKCAVCGGYILQNQNRPSACKCEVPVRADNTLKGNIHPTVKPIALMQYLIRLVTPKGGLLLDPFGGSGTTGCAAELEETGYVMIEQEMDYVEISEMRCAYWAKKFYQENKMQPSLFDGL